MKASPSQKNAQEKNLSIVIPTTDIKGSKSREQINNLLNSIIEGNIDKYCNVIVVFDACHPYFIEDILDSYPFILAIVNNKNRLHFARNSNLGLRYAHQILKTSVVLVNQDCILPAWEHFSKLPGKGIVTPTSIPQSEGLNKAQPPQHKRVEVREKFPFYCVFISKEVMDEIGYLDGVFCKPTFEDDDYLTRALLKGLTCTKTNVIVSHMGSHIDTSGEWESTSGSYTKTDLGENLMKYGTKWQVPAGVPHEKILEYILENHTFTQEMVVR